MERQATVSDKIFTIHISDKGFAARICKELTKKMTNNTLEKKEKTIIKISDQMLHQRKHRGGHLKRCYFLGNCR